MVNTRERVTVDDVRTLRRQDQSVDRRLRRLQLAPRSQPAVSTSALDSVRSASSATPIAFDEAPFVYGTASFLIGVAF